MKTTGTATGLAQLAWGALPLALALGGLGLSPHSHDLEKQLMRGS